MINVSQLPPIEEFDFNELYLEVFKCSKMTSILNIIYWTQRYKILPDSEVYRVLSSYIDDEVIYDPLQLNINVEVLFGNTLVQTIYRDYNVLLLPIDKNRYTVICPIGGKFKDKGRLDLTLSGNQLEYVWCTEYSFEKLLDNQGRVPDYLFLFRRILAEGILRDATDICFDVVHYGSEAIYTINAQIDIRYVKLLDFNLTLDEHTHMVKSVIDKFGARSSADIDDKGLDVAIKSILGNFKKGMILRLSANKCMDGYSYVYRIQDPKTTTLTINQLGFDDDIVESLEHMKYKTGGLTLITGPIRSGKNTTQFAIANDLVAVPSRKISYESPIETYMPFTQVDYEGNIDYLRALITRAKKQNLGYAFLNEIPTSDVAFAVRDLVNASVHTITTLHINRIWNLPQKLEEYFGDKYKGLIMQLNAVYNQKIFGVQCPHCATKSSVSAIEDFRIRSLLEKHGVNFFYKNEGCKHCVNGNLVGKVQPYVEFLEFDNELKIKLTKCNSPSEMEVELLSYVKDKHKLMEDSICKAISEGKLQYSALRTMI